MPTISWPPKIDQELSRKDISDTVGGSLQSGITSCRGGLEFLVFTSSGEVNLARYAAEIICGDGSWLCGSDDGSKLGLDGFNVEFSIGISKDEEEEFLALLDSDYVDAIRSPGSEPYRRRQEEIARWQAENQE